MLDRIQAILQHFELTPSRLADQLEVPRSTISHILSERNKPSLEFLQKVLYHYPEINTEWLVMGKGKMTSVAKQDLFSGSDLTSVSPEKKTDLSQNEEFPSEISTDSATVRHQSIDKNLRRESVMPDSGEKSNNQDVMSENAKEVMVKKIVQIITIYSDSTFNVYYPNK